MVEQNDNSGGRQGLGFILSQKLKGLSLDDRVAKLATFTPKSVLYDEALSATQVTLVKDEETDLVSHHSISTLSDIHLSYSFRPSINAKRQISAHQKQARREHFWSARRLMEIP